MRRAFPSVLAFIWLASNMSAQKPSFPIVEATISDMRRAMERGTVTSRELVEQYLARIEKYEGTLNAIITLNPRALQEAEARDRERAAGKILGPLHGIPVAVKDNIQTTDMPTTGGALAFKAFVPPYEATVVANLRNAGAIILGKTNMTELANWVAQGMPGNFNALAGFGFNPYDPRPDPRAEDGRPVLTPGGSSSGTGTAANFWAANVGTETSGSILSPANLNMLAAIKPTVGRVSRYGIIPITADQDTAGPMARTVADAAILLGVLEGRTADVRDPATRTCARVGDYTRYLNARALRGARIGIPRTFFYDDQSSARLMTEAIAVLKKQGAVIVDPAELPSVVTTDPLESVRQFQTCSGSAGSKGRDEGCSTVFKYGMKRDFNRWLSSLGSTAPVKTLSELRQWNLEHQAEGAIRFGQAQLDNSDAMDLEADYARYQEDRQKDLRLSALQGIDAVMKSERLDALLFPGAKGAAVAAKPGYPTVIVPFGFITPEPDSALPPGFVPASSPFGVSFTGMACSEPRLIELAYAFERATRRRVPPSLFP